MLSASRYIARQVITQSRRHGSGKVVKFGVDGRALILQGVDLLADAVQVWYFYSLIFLLDLIIITGYTWSQR